MEKHAHRFAGAFLAPGDAILDDLREHGNRVTLRTLATLKATWGVSIKALVMRFQGLGVVGDDHARSLYKQISARGWNKSEPVDVGGEEAIWLQKAILKFAGNAPNSLQAAADASGLGVSHFRRWTDWESHGDADADVLAFDHQRPRRAKPSGDNAPKTGGLVTPLRTRRSP